MKRNIEPEYEFQKEKFITLWKRAVGDRSYSAFGKEAGISFGYISKYMNGKCDVAPTIPTIKKIANAAKDVTYAELLEAAGYNPEIHDDDVLEPLAHEGITITNRLLATLTNVNFSWRFENPIGGSNGPISVALDDAPFKKWYFIPITRENISKEDITSVLGSKEAECILPGEKVSFITTDIKIYEQLVVMEFNLISLRMSVMYVAPGELLISQEKYIKSAIDIADADLNISITNKSAVGDNVLKI